MKKKLLADENKKSKQAKKEAKKQLQKEISQLVKLLQNNNTKLTRVKRKIVIKQQAAKKECKDHKEHKGQTEAGLEHDFQT